MTTEPTVMIVVEVTNVTHVRLWIDLTVLRMTRSGIGAVLLGPAGESA